MSGWSAEPFGNDTAADWAWELDDHSDWGAVRSVLGRALMSPELDEEDATVAIAAAEVVAHGLGRATQSDPYTESVEAFVDRVDAPDPALVALARSALARATSQDSALAQIWGDAPEWRLANARIAAALA